MNSDKPKLLVALVILGLASFFLFRFLRSDRESGKTFFYDLSAKKLYTASRTLIPPVQGVNGPEQDGVRAVVISTTGDASDRKSWKIAYLEKYSPELKAQLEAALKTGATPEISRAAAQTHRFVKRPEDADWFPMTSPEGERIVSEWTMAGQNGATPVVCQP